MNNWCKLFFFVLIFTSYAEHERNQSTFREFLKGMAIGSSIGATEAVIDHPFTFVKNRLQQGDSWKKVLSSYRNCLRGFLTNFGSTSLVTACQVSMHKLLSQQQNGTKKADLSLWNIASSFSAGSLSAFIDNPIELIVLHQQNTNKSASTLFNSIKKQHGILGLLRGLTPTMIREGGFASGYLAFMPWLKQKLTAYTKDPILLTLGPGISAGVTASIVTHPFDCIKTKMQANINNPVYSSIRHTIRDLYQKEGIKGFFKGLTPRCCKVASLITFLGFSTEKLSESFNT